MKAKEILSGLALSGGWFLLLVSLVFYAFFWRVDNEPGAKDIPALLWAAVSFCSMGGLAFLGGHILLIKEKAWWILLAAWGLCIALLVGALSLAPILLLFMV